MIRVYYKWNVKGENKLFKRNKTLAGILAIFLGTLGIHKFYQGKWKAGIAYFLFFWTGIPTILGILDGAKLLTEVADEVPDENASAKKEKSEMVKGKGKTEKPDKSDEITISEKSENQTENKAEKKSENKPEKRNMKSRLSDLKNHDDSEEDEDDYDDTEE